MDVAYTL
jgi:hypothetical protein